MAALLYAQAATGASLSGEIRDQAGVPVADAVVVARPSPPAPLPGTGEGRTAVVDQRNREFLPHVLAIRAGTAVQFPNSDRIQHHVYSFSPGNRFEIKLYKGTPAQPIRFDRPGVVVLGCNIHDWMLAYVYVADTPHYTQTDIQGRWSLEVPAGEYRLAVWHPDAERGGVAPTRILQAGAEPVPPWNPVVPLTSMRRTGKPPASLQEQEYRGDP